MAAVLRKVRNGIHRGTEELLPPVNTYNAIHHISLILSYYHDTVQKHCNNGANGKEVNQMPFYVHILHHNQEHNKIQNCKHILYKTIDITSVMISSYRA